MRDRSHLISIIAIILAAVLLLGGGILLYASRTNASRVERFRGAARQDWKVIADQAEKVTVALLRVNAPADLEGVATSAREMSGKLERVSDDLEAGTLPAGYTALAEKQRSAVRDLASYVSKVSELASAGDQSSIMSERGIIESRSRKALNSANDFLSEAGFVEETIPGDFYIAAKSMLNAWQPPAYANEAEAQAVYETATRFLTADVKESNFDVIMSMLSSRMIAGLNYYNITKESLAGGWTKAWGSKRATDFYISRRHINIPDPTTATVVVIAYVEGGEPRIETIRLVKEKGVWKVDNYPFVGIQG